MSPDRRQTLEDQIDNYIDKDVWVVSVYNNAGEVQQTWSPSKFFVRIADYRVSHTAFSRSSTCHRICSTPLDHTTSWNPLTCFIDGRRSIVDFISDLP